MESKGQKSAKGNEIMRGERSDNRFLFMFIRRTDGRYVLYKIDVLNCLDNKPDHVPLSPLIVFGSKALPTNVEFAFDFIKPYFYIIGSDKNKIFTIKKSDLLNTDPSEMKRGSEFLNPVNPMYGNKFHPLAFNYKKKLYVISKGYYPLWEQIGKSFYDFEVYSPKEKIWTDLGNKPLREVSIKSYLVHNDMVYFTTTLDVVLSFNLMDGLWVSIFDPFGVLVRCPETYKHPRPTFDTQIQIIGNTIFGGIYRFLISHFDIASSSAINPNDDFFLRPNLTHDKEFFDHIYSVPYDLRHQLSHWSKSIVTVDKNEEIMCIVGYGNYPYDELANYASLTFFKVSADSYKGDILRVPPEGANEEVAPIPYSWNNQFHYANDEDVRHVNFFRADFISSCFMPIDTKKEVTPGVIYSSLLV